MKPDQIEIERRNQGDHGAYLARDGDGAELGKLTWTLRDGARDAEHTIVPPQMRGRGIAARLVDALIEDARSDGFTIIPSCSYVAAQFDRHPDWADLRG
ncbi:MAG: N-acetyltransferase [Erythrobacter sp.]|uniref:GNAT family N-acetyltransferase n=1 Tax=Erythrobacter sp. TaxID=1042 RepID=UPI001B0EC052|nr:GNAT family N-acetyltransferase [Erythrobacter sp.]MBO6767133.1 N-acetyltransferase [Erythrobacter sp.]